MSTHPDPALIDDLVLANHILVNQGVLDGFGHISVRDPANPQRFFIARSMAPALVQADDILACDLDSNVIDERGRKTYLERFIHGEIFKMRPDVNAVIHSHSPSVIPFGVTGARFALTEVTIGIMPGAGGTQTLPRIVGERRAKEIILTGKPFTAEQALEWGILNRVCAPEEVLPAALETARVIAGNAPLSIRQAKRSMHFGLQMDLRFE